MRAVAPYVPERGAFQTRPRPPPDSQGTAPQRFSIWAGITPPSSSWIENPTVHARVASSSSSTSYQANCWQGIKQSAHLVTTPKRQDVERGPRSLEPSGQNRGSAIPLELGRGSPIYFESSWTARKAEMSNRPVEKTAAGFGSVHDHNRIAKSQRLPRNLLAEKMIPHHPTLESQVGIVALSQD
jgi:hypothetical protein